MNKNFYSHAPCGARRGRREKLYAGLQISTHTPLAGRDMITLRENFSDSHFYSHAPCGARLWVLAAICVAVIFLLTRPLRGATFDELGDLDDFTFLLTRPLRGATLAIYCQRKIIEFLLTRPLRGATPNRIIFLYVSKHFYSHAPCGARLSKICASSMSFLFLLTRPLRGATCQSHSSPAACHFYSHAPCGARQED